jgi:hypothetical protein
MTTQLSREPAVAHENRAHARRRTRQPIEFVSEDGTRSVGICTDLSLGGMRIDTEEPVSFGARVTIYIVLPDWEGEASFTGVVRWSKPGVMGVQLDSYGVRLTYALLRVLTSSP